MGYGTITDGGAAGLYTLALDFGTTRRDGLKTRYDERIAELEAQLPDLLAKRGTADAEIAAASEAEDAAIRLYAEAVAVEAPPEITTPLIQNVTTARRRVLFAQGQKAAIEIPIDQVKADIKALQLQSAALMSGTVSQSLEAWCVDLTEDAGGTVATIEVPGEPQHVLIAPGGRPPEAGDGFLLARHLMTPSQAFFNAAILPGWQKFKPTYRIGVIDALDSVGDTADVTLEAANSTAQDLDVNRETILRGIPVTYMTCNAAAFSVGDRVVVQFDTGAWNSARVIGFVDNPKACNWSCVYVDNFIFGHTFESIDLGVMADVFATSGIDVDYRLNLGSWVAMTYARTISRPELGGLVFNEWIDPALGFFDGPIASIGYNLSLSVGNDPDAPRINGLRISPNTMSAPEPSIFELRIMKAGEVLMNCAFRWYPSQGNEAPLAEVLATGGINIKVPITLDVIRLEGYSLYINTGT